MIRVLFRIQGSTRALRSPFRAPVEKMIKSGCGTPYNVPLRDTIVSISLKVVQLGLGVLSTVPYRVTVISVLLRVLLFPLKGAVLLWGPQEGP